MAHTWPEKTPDKTAQRKVGRNNSRPETTADKTAENIAYGVPNGVPNDKMADTIADETAKTRRRIAGPRRWPTRRSRHGADTRWPTPGPRGRTTRQPTQHVTDTEPTRQPTKDGKHIPGRDGQDESRRENPKLLRRDVITACENLRYDLQRTIRKTPVRCIYVLLSFAFGFAVQAKFRPTHKFFVTGCQRQAPDKMADTIADMHLYSPWYL